MPRLGAHMSVAGGLPRAARAMLASAALRSRGSWPDTGRLTIVDRRRADEMGRRGR